MSQSHYSKLNRTLLLISVFYCIILLMETEHFSKIYNYPNARNTAIHDIYNPCFNESRNQSFYNSVNQQSTHNACKRIKYFKRIKPGIIQVEQDNQNRYTNGLNGQNNQEVQVQREITKYLKKISQLSMDKQNLKFQSSMAAYNLLERFDINLLSKQKLQLVLLISKVIIQWENLMLDAAIMQRQKQIKRNNTIDYKDSNLSKVFNNRIQQNLSENKENIQYDDRVMKLNKTARMSSKKINNKHQQSPSILTIQPSSQNTNNAIKSRQGDSKKRFSNLSGKTTKSYQTNMQKDPKYPQMEITQSGNDRDLQIDVDLTQILEQMKVQIREQMVKKVQKSCSVCQKIIPSQNQIIGKLHKYLIEKDDRIEQLDSRVQQLQKQLQRLRLSQAEIGQMKLQLQESRNHAYKEIQNEKNYVKDLSDRNNQLLLEISALNQQLYNANVALQQAQSRSQDIQKAYTKILHNNRCLHANLAEIESQNQGIKMEFNIMRGQYSKLKENQQARLIIMKNRYSKFEDQIANLGEQKEELKQICLKLEQTLNQQRNKVTQDMDQVLRRCLYIQAVSFENVMLI